MQPVHCSVMNIPLEMHPQKFVVLLCSFTKFNSNTGWTPHDDTDWTAAMQALSHFSYHISGGDVVLCDMQGGTKRKGVCVTDLVVLSRTQAFGPTDFGAKGAFNGNVRSDGVSVCCTVL